MSAGRYRAIDACRVCEGRALERVLDLGEQCLTGVFPKQKGANVTKGPLTLVKCMGGCGLVQLAHSYELSELYGDNYGYRSGLNQSMVEHLRAKVKALMAHQPVGEGDVVLDIGSNDGTTLSFYPSEATLIGIDPTSAKFAKYYAPHIKRVPQFFSSRVFLEANGGQRAKILTSIAMFYDLERPLDFVRDIHASLADDGIWHFEQSYLPTMLAQNSYDTVCHEHLEYYAMEQICWMLDEVGFRIVEVSLNEINGGSFAVTARKGRGSHAPVVAEMLAKEKKDGLPGLDAYRAFAGRVARSKDELLALLRRETKAGAKVFGIGASTKGNVILQYCGIGPDLVPCIAEVNEEKFGAFTPGAEIPIVSEADAYAKTPDMMLVLPWHFRANLVRRASAYLQDGGKLLFPLPRVDVVGA